MQKGCKPKAHFVPPNKKGVKNFKWDLHELLKVSLVTYQIMQTKQEGDWCIFITNSWGMI
jgi:hypothetical protein